MGLSKNVICYVNRLIAIIIPMTYSLTKQEHNDTINEANRKVFRKGFHLGMNYINNPFYILTMR